KLASGSGSGGSGQAGPSQRPSEAPEEGRLLSWLVREELSCQIQLKLLRQGRSLSASAVEDTERNVESPLSEETLQMQERRRAGNRLAARRCRAKRRLEFSQLTEQIRHSELELLRLRRCLDSARQEFAELLGDFPSPSCLLSFLTRRLEQADPLDPWLSRLLLNVRQILETASSTSFATDCRHLNQDSRSQLDPS
uniref:BZIP domain-containing protein n=2 Tax=Macrostomum lignano TaxID=282301 RepID=A0A1I8I4N8_9PLAT